MMEQEQKLTEQQSAVIKGDLRVVILRQDEVSTSRTIRTLALRYKDLFASTDETMTVLDWKPKNIPDLVAQILTSIRSFHPNRKGIRKIDDTMRSLAHAHPGIFGEYLAQASQKTRVVELLQKIKKSNPNMTFGRILSSAFASKNVCNVTLPLQLHRTSDKELEVMLNDYLALRKN